ncbi:hypothetical protein Tco_0770212 [Tanacetum coccineum]|uniref:Uncharacterized protein n=1 Tax=Tanacetum coccineum TaxID=301880 RepID=A0ABQ4ZCT1_9ASTR
MMMQQWLMQQKENDEKAEEEKKDEEPKGYDQAKNEQEADAAITSLMDIKIQHAVLNIQQDPLHEVPVSVLSNPTTLPTTPPLITPPPATTTEALVPPTFESETLTPALQRLSVVEQEVQELKEDCFYF